MNHIEAMHNIRPPFLNILKTILQYENENISGFVKKLSESLPVMMCPFQKYTIHVVGFVWIFSEWRVETTNEISEISLQDAAPQL